LRIEKEGLGSGVVSSVLSILMFDLPNKRAQTQTTTSNSNNTYINPCTFPPHLFIRVVSFSVSLVVLLFDF